MITNGFGPEKNGASAAGISIFAGDCETLCAWSAGAAGGSTVPRGNFPSTTRKPVFSLLASGSQAVRFAERSRRVCIEWLPPRMTRKSPSLRPSGLVCAAASYGPYQSAHHSETFPCMSTRPHAFAGVCPTRTVSVLAVTARNSAGNLPSGKNRLRSPMSPGHLWKPSGNASPV